MRTLLLATLALTASADLTCQAAESENSQCGMALSLLQLSANSESVALFRTDSNGKQEPKEEDAKKEEPAKEESKEEAKAEGDGTAEPAAASNASADNATSSSPSNASALPNTTEVLNATNGTNGTNVTNATNATDAPAAPTGCAVKEDPRIKAWFAETSPEGTPCVFGVDGDARDEGTHCIFDNGEYGSNGWCYTSTDRSSWGSCNGLCPLYGPEKQLGTKIDHVDKMVDKVMKAIGTNSTEETTAPPSEEANATKAE